MGITTGQVADLALFVPVELRRALENGVARSGSKAVRLSVTAFCARSPGASACLARKCSTHQDGFRSVA
jgi:hypothetical protein